MSKIKNKLTKIGWFESLAIIFVIVAIGKYAYIKYESKNLKRVVPLSLSMYPTLKVGGEYVFKEVTNETVLKRFDIVNFMVESKLAYQKYILSANCKTLVDKKNKCYQQSQLPFAKRIIGVPGDKINYSENKVLINDKEMNYSKMKYSEVNDILGSKIKNKGLYDFYDVYFEKNNHTIAILKDKRSVVNRSGFIKLKKNEYFMVGDNRNLSLDSRNFGKINKDNITHVIDYRYLEKKEKPL